MSHPSSQSEPPAGHWLLLQELSSALKDLHQSLLEEERAAHERAHGPVGGSAQLLDLLLHDPSFAWLRVLSEFMADLDGLLDEQEPPIDAEAAALRLELEQVLSAASSPQFWDRCVPLLQSPRVAMAYAHVRTVLASLPGGPAADVPTELHAKHRWAAARAQRHTPWAAQGG
jgi:hypothetical protein